MVPRPKHLPVDIWMPIASGKTIDMMARYGLKAMVTLNGEKILDDVVRAYHAACARHGRAKQLGEDMIWGAGTLPRQQPGGSDPQASSRRTTSATSGSRRSASCATPTSRAAPGARQARRRGSLRSRDGVEQKAWFCGPPAQVIDGIKSIEDKYPGLENFMIHWAEGLPPEEFKDQLTLVRQGRDAGVQARVRVEFEDLEE